MGAFLDKPKTEKTIGKGTGYNLEWGVSAMQGWRMEMEDAHTCETKLRLKDWGFFAVFDGHAGPRVSEFCAQHLLPTILETAEKSKKSSVVITEEEIAGSMLKAFSTLDNKVCDHLKQHPQDRGGTTAVAIMISPQELIWANCGDSRALLCRDGKLHFSTTDHKPYNTKEKERIEKAGGTVMMQRVNGSLAVSRALGDFDYKREPYENYDDQLVSPEPEVNRFPRHKDDDFVFLACDGVFDVMKNDDIIQFVLYHLQLESDLSKICSDLIDTCLNKNSKDNMSAILITFPHAPKLSEEAIAKDKKAKEEVRKKIENRIRDIGKTAQDPLDLEENYIVHQLSTEFPDDVDVFSQRPFISERLRKLRITKFGKDGEIFHGQSDSSQAPPEFAGQLDPEIPVSLGTEDQNSETESQPTPMEDKPSSNDKLEQNKSFPT